MLAAASDESFPFFKLMLVNVNPMHTVNGKNKIEFACLTPSTQVSVWQREIPCSVTPSRVVMSLKHMLNLTVIYKVL